MNVKYKLNLDVYKDRNYESIIVAQNDDKSRIIECKLYADSQPVALSSSVTAAFNATVDNVIVAENVPCIVADNAVKITLAKSMLQLAGMMRCELVLSENDTILTTQHFRVYVNKSVINSKSKYEPAGSNLATEAAVAKAKSEVIEYLETELNEKISAKLLCNTPQMFGAIGNGIADDTNAIQRAVDLGLPVYIPKGTYKITKPILAKDMYIDGDTQAIIESDCNDKAAFELNVESPNLGYISRNSYIRNITINVNNGKYGIHYNRTHNLSLKNIKIKNFSVAGILAGSLTDGVKSYNIETVASGLVLFNESAILGSVGIRNLTTDSFWKDIIVYNTDVGIEPGGNDIVTCHYWNSLEELTETCTAFVLRDNVNATLSSCCSDSSRYAVRLGDYSRATINGLRIIYAAAMIEKYAKVSDCVIIDSAEDPANPGKYYSSCTAHVSGLEIKAQTSVNLKILSDYLFNRYKTLPAYWRNISISSSFIAPDIANQPSLGFENFSNTQGTRNRDGVGGISDCNTKEVGIYRCTTSTANIPETAKGMLICLSSGEYNWSQIYITSSALWIRYSSSATTWGSWVKVNQS